MFDSDLDTSDFSEVTDVGSSEALDCSADDTIEFLDVQDIADTDGLLGGDAEDGVRSDIDNEGKASEIIDGVYHAARMSQDEVDRIDEMWQTESPDVEPYHATARTNNDAIDVVEPYQAVRNSDSGDLVNEISSEREHGDISDTESLEDSFAAQVEAMSFDDLQLEQSRLDQLGQMDDLDIFAEYDNDRGRGMKTERFHDMIDGMDRESLQQLRDGLVDGDPDVYEQLGLREQDDSSSDERGLSLNRRR